MRFALSVAVVMLFGSQAFAADDPKSPAFPRRLLVVHASHYLYLNPLTHGTQGGADRVRDAADRLAEGLRVPTAAGNNQLFVLADTLPASEARFPTKEMITKTLDSFIATTRAQDRVVVYFGAHAIEKDGKAYLVPVEGDLSDVNTLVPVSSIYAKLKDLEAAQKLVIWDVCRMNPERIRSRRDPGPMTEALFKALSAAPYGIQALISCSPGEHSLEYSTPRGPAGLFAGSAFLDALRQAAADDRSGNPKATPNDAIPVDALHKSAGKSLAAVAKQAGVVQTPAQAGTPVKPETAYDPKEEPAKRFDWPTPKTAAADDVKAILNELALPPLVAGEDALPANFPFSAEALKNYPADATPDEILMNADKYPLRVATLRAFQTVRDTWPLGKDARGMTTLAAPVTDRAKKSVAAAQDQLALAIAQLELELENLLAVADKRATETKRWQAHYDYAVAEVRLRLVVFNELNVSLAKARTETLPDLPPGGSGWRLVASDKLQSGKAVQAIFTSATDDFTRLATAYKGTPWEVLAWRTLALQPGLRWEPIPVAKEK